MTSRILPTPARSNLHGTDIFPVFANKTDILGIWAMNQRRKVNFSDVYSFYVYTPEQLEKAIYMLSAFDIRVSDEISSIIKVFSKEIEPSLELEIRSNRLRNNTALSSKRIKYWLDKFYEKACEKRFNIPTNKGTNIFFDILHMFFNAIIGNINKIIRIRRIITPTTPLTIENRDTLLIYFGLYTSMFIYMLHLFFKNKFITTDTNVILPKNLFYDNLLNPIYNELISLNAGLPRIQSPLKKIQLKITEKLETDILTNSLPTAPTRGGKKKI